MCHPHTHKKDHVFACFFLMLILIDYGFIGREKENHLSPESKERKMFP